MLRFALTSSTGFRPFSYLYGLATADASWRFVLVELQSISSRWQRDRGDRWADGGGADNAAMATDAPLCFGIFYGLQTFLLSIRIGYS